MAEDVVSIGLFGKDDPLRRVLAVALRGEGFDVYPVDPDREPLPAANPDALLYQQWYANGHSADLVGRWRHLFPGAAIIEMRFYSTGKVRDEADLILDMPFRLEELVEAIRFQVTRRGVAGDIPD